MNLSEINEVTKRIAEKVRGTVIRKEFLITDKKVYIVANNIEEVDDFVLWTQSNGIVPLIVNTSEFQYVVGDTYNHESKFSEVFGKDVLIIQGDNILHIVNNIVVTIEGLQEHAL